MEFFKIRSDIPFMRHALAFNVVSLITFLLAVFFLVHRGLNFSIEFTGGTVMEVSYPDVADVDGIRKGLDSRGYNDYSVQNFGSSHDVLIRMPLKPGQNTSELSKSVMEAINAQDKTATLRRVEFVGPQVGEELAWNGALALLITSIGIVAYLAFRFEWKFGLAAIVANLHDVVIILGFFALFQWEFSLPVLAAVLAVLGYSVNESVVIADRIRENFRKMRKATVIHVIDNAITSTISRTIITHGSTLMMVLSILFFGGEPLHYFALALTIGFFFVVESPVRVMAPLVMSIGVSLEDLVYLERKAGATVEKSLP